MIEYKGKLFCCDECPICEGISRRITLAKIYEHEPQFEYCGCDKTEFEFYLGGYCEDAFRDKKKDKKTGKRNTGRSYRRVAGRQKFEKKVELGRYVRACSIGYPEYDHVRGPHSRMEPTGKYLRYPKNSKSQKYWKRYSNKLIRRRGDAIQNGQYRRLFDYWWEIY